MRACSPTCALVEAFTLRSVAVAGGPSAVKFPPFAVMEAPLSESWLATARLQLALRSKGVGENEVVYGCGPRKIENNGVAGNRHGELIRAAVGGNAAGGPVALAVPQAVIGASV